MTEYRNKNQPERNDDKVARSSQSFSKDREEGSFSATDVLQSDEHLSLKEVCCVHVLYSHIFPIRLLGLFYLEASLLYHTKGFAEERT